MMAVFLVLSIVVVWLGFGISVGLGMLTLAAWLGVGAQEFFGAQHAVDRDQP